MQCGLLDSDTQSHVVVIVVTQVRNASTVTHPICMETSPCGVIGKPHMPYVFYDDIMFSQVSWHKLTKAIDSFYGMGEKCVRTTTQQWSIKCKSAQITAEQWHRCDWLPSGHVATVVWFLLWTSLSSTHDGQELVQNGTQTAQCPQKTLLLSKNGFLCGFISHKNTPMHENLQPMSRSSFEQKHHWWHS